MYRFLRSSLLRRGLGPLVLLTVVAVVAATVPLAVLHGGLKKLMAASVAGTRGAGPRDLLITSSATLNLTVPPYEPGTPFAVTYGARVTLQRVVDNVPAIAPWDNNRSLTPNQGQRFLGLQLTLTNTGSTAMGYGPPVVVTTDPDPTYTASGTDATMAGCEPLVQFPPASLQPGQSVTVCDVYSMPTGDQVVAVTYNYGGFPEPTANGRWTIDASAPSGAGSAPITGVAVRQTSGTPLWKLRLEVSLDATKVACPTTVTVTSAGLSAAAPACANGRAQSPVSLLLPVYSAGHQLTPGGHAVVHTTLHDGRGTTSSDTTIAVPAPPLWITVGDSFSSGYHQAPGFTGLPDCGPIWGIPRGVDRCGLVWNDAAFSWSTRAVDRLNRSHKVPPDWQMQARILALGGAATSEMVGATRDPLLANVDQNQLLRMYDLLQQNAGSWNVVSVTGGANDTTWVKVIEAFYKSNPGQVPWKVTSPASCPNASQLVADINIHRTTITSNLLQILEAAHTADASARLVDVMYPYIDNANSVCFKPHRRSDGTTAAGNEDVIDGLDTIHAEADRQYKAQTGGGVLVVDSQSVFGLSPLSQSVTSNPVQGYIQRVAYYGYPHPNDAGQDALALAAASKADSANP